MSDVRTKKVDAYEFSGIVDKIVGVIENQPSIGWAYREQLLYAVVAEYAPAWVLDNVNRMFEADKSWQLG